MSVLTLSGKPIDWRKPPKPTARVMWSRRTSGGKLVTGSLRTIAHLDHLDALARSRFKQGIVVLQPPYNTGVAKSAGTHDFDACIDCYIPGVSWTEQEQFFRNNGAGAYWRRPPSFGNHIHYFTLPPREGKDVSDDYRVAGFKVGKYVDGGWSIYGRRITSSQIEDYYNHRTALAGHAYDPSKFPSNIAGTIFDLDKYIKKQLGGQPVEKKVKPLGLSWNMRTGRNKSVVAKELDALIRANGRPKFVALQEAKSYRSVVKAVALARGYKVQQPRNKGKAPEGVRAREAGSTVLLVRRERDVLAKGVIRVDGTWVGPKAGVVHEGRVLPWQVIRMAGKWILVVSVHMPTGKNGVNKKAWDRTLKAITDLVKDKGYPPFILPGDWNDPHTSAGPRSPRQAAERMGGRVEHAQPRIDYALVHRVPVKVTRAAKRGSDHHAIRLVKKNKNKKEK